MPKTKPAITPEQKTSLKSFEASVRRSRKSGEAVSLTAGEAEALWQLTRYTHRAVHRRLNTAEAVADWGRALQGLTHEEIWVLCLDSGLALLEAHQVARGGTGGAGVFPREILRAVLATPGSTAYILVHNHPGGDPTPSREDVDLTRALTEASAAIGIPLLDHVIVARSRACSLADLGLVQSERAAA